MRRSTLAQTAALAAIAATSTFAASSTPVADRIRYDAQCFTINGRDTLVYSGAFHYFRCPKPLWAARLQSMKSAGLSTLETYVAWNWHERTPPANVDDTSKLDMTDLHDFLDLAIHQFGFNVILRPGPYICAEWDGGGYPQWLRLKEPAGVKGMWYRGDDPTYLAWCKHWFDAVAKVAGPFQITQQPAGQPGIILWQIENEYSFDGAHSGEVKLHQLQALAHDSRDAGIDVPLFTCETEDARFRQDPYLRANVIETHNSYPGFDVKGFVSNIDSLRPYQPEKPLAMTELQGGWFSQVGGALSQARGYNAAQITQLTMLAWAHGYTSTNYYMMFGGTNFGDWAAANITTSYDYAAPLRECGGVDERYQAVSSMAHMIQQIGPKLVRAELEQSHVDGEPPAGVTAVVRKATDGSRFVFVFNSSQTESALGTLKLALDDEPGTVLNVDVDLKPFDAKVMVLPAGSTDTSKGDWLPKILPLPQRPTSLPPAIVVNTIKHKADPGPTDWKPVTGDRSEEAAGVFDRRFVYYRATLPQKLPFKHTAVACRSGLSSAIAGGIEGSASSVAPRTGSAIVVPIDAAGGGKTFSAVYENNGRPNGGALMEAPGGITSMSLVDADATPVPLGAWRMKRLDKADDGSHDTGLDVDVSQWKPFKPGSATELVAGQSAVYRCAFNLTPADIDKHKTELAIGRIDDRGSVYVNGELAGESTEWDKPVKLDLSKQLHAGKNLIAVIVHNDSGSGGLGLGVTLQATPAAGEDPSALQYEIGAQCTGDASNWFAADFDDSSWASAAESTKDHPSSLDWYRFHFAVPTPPAHAWVPLKLRLDAVGSGFIYLNGHPLGRWWEQGPQKDYFLPECWLKRDGDNVVAISLLGAKGEGVKAASVLPYEDLSETRP